MPTYDLRTEPWIPVRFLDGTFGSVGLRDALARAHEIQEIALDNPMETSGLYRLLLALSVRIFPDTEEYDIWFESWELGHFDAAPIDSYFKQWSDRFDLFHPTHPFYQVTTNIGQSLLPVGILRLDEGGNTSSLFSHDDLRQDATLLPNEAARGIVASQHAAIGGLLSNPYKTGNKHSPAVSGTIFWMRGVSLFYSLLLNAPPSLDARMGGRVEGDVPSWECDASAAPESRLHRGFLDYLTFQHRRITLKIEERETGLIVSGLWRTGGNAEQEMPLNDPHMAIIADEKTGPRRYNVQTGKAVWRDSPLFLTMMYKWGTPPGTVQWVKSELQDLGISELEIEVFALRTRGANDGTIKLWRHERIPLLLNILTTPERGSRVVEAMELANTQAGKLTWATLLAAALLRSPTKEFNELSSLEKEDARKLARSLDTESRYWAALEAHFFSLLRSLAEALNSRDDPDWATDLMKEWKRRLRRAAVESYDAATRSINSNARQLRAVAEGRAIIRPTARYSTVADSLTLKSVNEAKEETA